jgi:hypothetical protein
MHLTLPAIPENTPFRLISTKSEIVDSGFLWLYSWADIRWDRTVRGGSDRNLNGKSRFIWKILDK